MTLPISTTAPAPDFIHAFVPGADPTAPPLLMLHGTGGDERDLLDLGHMVSPGSALLSPRGKVSEHGAPRFFRRHAEGLLDEDDLRARTEELADWIAAQTAAHGLPAPIAVGFSNGANIAASILLLRPEVLSGAVLMRAMAPYAQPPVSPEGRRRALILSGLADPIAPAETALKLEAMLRAAGAEVTRRSVPANHGLTQADVVAARDWIAAARAA